MNTNTALEKIKEAEGQAEKIVNQAKEEAKKIVLQAILEKERILKNRLAAAKSDADNLKLKFDQGLSQEISAIETEIKEDLRRLREKAKNNFQTALEALKKKLK